MIVQLRRLIDLRHYTAHCTSPHSLPGQLIFTRGIQLDPSQQIKLNNCLNIVLWAIEIVYDVLTRLARSQTVRKYI